VHFSVFSGCAECLNATRPGALDFSDSKASSTRAEHPLFYVAAIRGGLKYFFINSLGCRSRETTALVPSARAK
jgi:hypothetical protein